MPETFEQSLDVCRLEFNSLKRFKRKLDENDEYIDVTGCPPAKRANIDLIGGSPEKPASIDRYPPKNLSFSIDQSPSKKIYYDHIGSEFDGGGFFDRDDLDDEDDRDGLVIDCRLNESWEKKTDNGISHDERISNGPDLTEPEVVVNLNVVDVEVVGSEPIDVEALYPDENLTVTEPCNLVNTKVIYDESIDVEKLYPEVTVTGCSSVSISEPINLVDTKVVYNEPIDVEKLYPKVTVPACNSVSIAETINLVDTKVVNNEPIDVEQLYPETETSPDCRPVANNTMSYSFPDRSRSSTRESNLSAVPSTSYHSRRNAASSQPIRNLPYNWNNTETCLPPQFGFGPTYLCKSFGSKEKYPPEYYATLNAHARMMEAMSPDELKRYARLILSSTPIPEHTGPPPTAFRPRLVPVKLHPSIFKIHQQQQSREVPPVKQHPSISSMHQPQQSRALPKSQPYPFAPAAVPRQTPASQPPPSVSQPLKAPPIAAKMPRKMQSQKAPDSSASAVASRRQQQQQAAFSSIYERNHQTMAEHINQVINEFFDHRRNEVFNLVKMCTTRNVYSMDFLIEKLGHLRVSVNRDYVRMAETMIERYRYRYRPGVPRCWVEPATQAQDFQDYFEKVFEYQPKAEEMLGIYKVVIEGLLQQYRGSIEHFLTSNLER
ncbi:uncharacterized protein LOC128735131 [Sabethes cyaneus]|uniref:uncharacterized protein LOC128735131 n=1 Tax=Sabethes cyaneus TaxID=53552 RepID=UPI00237D55AC|nr:uncharacterized protein LOC128735131 [Sabethes cyaneus]